MLKEVDVYSVVALALGVAASLAGLVFALAGSLSRKGATAPTRSPAVTLPRIPQGHAVMGRRLHVRFTAPMIVSILLITLAMLLVPCSGWLAIRNDAEVRFRWLLVMLTLSGSAFFALLYCVHKGDLSWESE